MGTLESAANDNWSAPQIMNLDFSEAATGRRLVSLQSSRRDPIPSFVSALPTSLTEQGEWPPADFWAFDSMRRGAVPPVLRPHPRRKSRVNGNSLLPATLIVAGGTTIVPGVWPMATKRDMRRLSAS